jgi:hypothetical protein
MQLMKIIEQKCHGTGYDDRHNVVIYVQRQLIDAINAKTITEASREILPMGCKIYVLLADSTTKSTGIYIKR